MKKNVLLWWMSLLGSGLLMFSLGCSPESAEFAGNLETTENAETTVPTPTEDEQVPAAVEFPPSADWVNTGMPLSMDELRGRFVLLDFWTYGCVNCYHMIPQLNALHERYDGRLVVVGVHSAKFSHEGETENILEAVSRYDIRYPVLNDSEMILWSAYGVPGWPTIVLIDPEGSIVGGTVGEWPFEPMAELLDAVIASELPEDPTPLQGLQIASQPMLPPTLLRFPDGILPDPDNGVVYIADTGNHRVIAAEIDTGLVRQVYGSGVPGLVDGTHTSAEFAQPSGLSVVGDVLYVADAESSSVRAVSLAEASGDREGVVDAVQTLVGSGLFEFGDRDGPVAQARLMHASGVAAVGEDVYIADTYNGKLKLLRPGEASARPFELRLSGGAEQGLLLAGLVDRNEGAIRVDVELPPGYRLNAGSPNSVVARNLEGRSFSFPLEENLEIPIESLIESRVIDPDNIRQSLELQLWLYYCREENPDICLFDGASYTVALELSTNPVEPLSLRRVVRL